jgi:hypothetical protein
VCACWRAPSPVASTERRGRRRNTLPRASPCREAGSSCAEMSDGRAVEVSEFPCNRLRGSGREASFEVDVELIHCTQPGFRGHEPLLLRVA